MNHTTAKVSPGQTSASFPIRLPRWTDAASENSKSVGRPISVRLDVAQQNLQLLPQASVSIMHSYNYYPFRLNHPYDWQVTMANLSHRLERHTNQCRKHYPSNVDVPSLFLDETADPNNPRWTLELPANSSFFTTYEEFLPGLGFRDQQDINLPIVGRGAHPVAAYGFANRGHRGKRVILSTLVTFPNLMAGVTLPVEVAVPPAVVQFQIGMYDFQREVVAVREPVTRTKRGLARGLRLLLDAVRTATNYATNLVDVVEGGGGVNAEDVVVTNRTVDRKAHTDAMKLYGTAILIVLSPALADALGMPPPGRLTFDLEAAKTYVLSVREVVEDPLKGKFPVTLIAQGFGPAQSYVEGKGYVPFMAIMHDEHRPIQSDGFRFETSATTLTLEFYDKFMKRITFDNEVEIHLLLKFTQTL